jgi:undecaprenyldiphospho-muramoylpentapeptide beta-N-acetylglucosaminyltransferase
MRLMVCAGATGGGINPALAVLQAFKEDNDQVLWVGAVGGMEAELVARAGIPFASITAGGLHGVGLRTFTNLFKLAQGYFQAQKLIRQFRPDVLFFTGGYVAAPVGLAGRKLPTLVCLPDIEPGLAIKALTRFADHIVVPAEESRQFFPASKPVTVTGYPVRKELASWEPAKAYKTLGLHVNKQTLLVMGGSLGARSINQALQHILPDLLQTMQVVHLTGQANWQEVEAARQELPAALAKDYHTYAYLHEELGAAFTAADLIISRAGASILGELPLFGLPAILVPYPHAWRYQIVNANYLAKHGAAVVLQDEDLPVKLLAQVKELMQNKTNLVQMKAAMQLQARPGAAREIASILRSMASSYGDSS